MIGQFFLAILDFYDRIDNTLLKVKKGKFMKLKSIKKMKKITNDFKDVNLFNFKNVFRYFRKIFFTWFSLKIVLLCLILSSLAVTQNFEIILVLGILGTFTSSCVVATLRTIKEYPKLIEYGKLLVSEDSDIKRQKVILEKKINKKHYNDKPKEIKEEKLNLDLEFLESIKELYLSLDSTDVDARTIKLDMLKLNTLRNSYPTFYNKELIINQVNEILEELKNIEEKHKVSSLKRKRY